MTSVSRTAQFAKTFKVLRKCYKPAPLHANRTVVEQLLFACCLEDAHHDAAEEAFAAMVHTFFDWNEVRVASISELSEVLARLPDPRAASNRIKRLLYAVFEATFDFDLEEKRKKTLGPTITWLEKLDGITRFVVAYVVQSALGGHSIPIDTGTMAALRVLDLVTEKDAAAGVVPGLERAIAKSKGAEFGSLLHELGADFSANPYSANLRAILVQIDPEAVGRLPKRRVERPPVQKPAAAPSKTKDEPGKAHGGDKRSADHAAKATPEKAGVKKKPAREYPRAAEKSKKKPAASVGAEKSSLSGIAKKKSPSEGLAKRKPR